MACEPTFAGAGYTCDEKSTGLALPGELPSPIPGTLVVPQIAIGVKFEVTPEGAVEKDAGCDTDTRAMHVTMRDTTLGYTGAAYSAPSKTVTLTANLVDEYGQPVAGFVFGK